MQGEGQEFCQIEFFQFRAHSFLVLDHLSEPGSLYPKAGVSLLSTGEVAGQEEWACADGPGPLAGSTRLG